MQPTLAATVCVYVEAKPLVNVCISLPFSLHLTAVHCASIINRPTPGIGQNQIHPHRHCIPLVFLIIAIEK